MSKTNVVLTPRMLEALSACPSDWGLFDTVQDSLVWSLEEYDLIEVTLRKRELPGGKFSRSYARFARITTAGAALLFERGLDAAEQGVVELPPELGLPTMGDEEDAERLRAAYGPGAA